jgi:hypothetical protein
MCQELEHTTAVAIRDPATGAVWSAPGAIHADLMKAVAPNTSIEEGFTTSRGRFVNRDVAARLNKEIWCVEAKRDPLFSE